MAVEAGLGRRYYAAGIKSRVAEAAPHFDFAPLLTGLPPNRDDDDGKTPADDAAGDEGLVVSQIREQLSWNIYTAMPAATGETTIYNASAVSVGPRPAGENPTSVPAKQLEGLPVCVVRPAIGDLLIMRCAKTKPPTIAMPAWLTARSAQDARAAQRGGGCRGAARGREADADRLFCGQNR